MGWLKCTFWGVRGSVPVPGPATRRYGGNTACLDLRSDAGDWLIFDAGTGIRVLGASLDLSKKHDIHLLISHPHWDHISGFPFFPPIYIPGNRVTVYGPGTFEMSLEDIISGQMKYSYFPVRTVELLADISYRQLQEERIQIGGFTVDTISLNHPVACLGYRVTYGDKRFVYYGDNEPYFNLYDDRSDREMNEFVGNLNRRLVDFAEGADALVSDAQYLPSEYPSKVGWGHSTTHHVLNMAVKAKAKKIFFFHHEPMRSDDELDRIMDFYRNRIREKNLPIEAYAAMEGMTFEV